ncbi:MAG: GTP 3',8-cyclase MoaA [Bacteroidetes bacterium]|nr:GTP 3',8-cyclase MoaA [Bacteroidota bacterium]MCC6655072.1 GTP 3',8-cyclase MoaA [Flavobacteriales bacterium]HNK68017.1 GTP 3',8-cyclase MoaA [Flavobacteriales bacterium]HNM69372.1 GTP 3',8-cyclase MoaA [Flavobacteriales bacterium]
MTHTELIDRFGRRHDYLRISLTERCNLRCVYCMPAEGIMLRPREQFMRAEEVIVMARMFTDLGVKKIRLTGGEPLVRKDAAQIITELGRLPVELAITTNGVLVDQFVDVFKEAGLRSVNVSLDSLRPERMQAISRRDPFARTTANIRLLQDEGFHVKVNMVVMRGVNDDEVTDFMAWSRNEPVHVRFIEFMPFDGNRWDWSKGVSGEEILARATERFGATGYERLTDRPNDTARNYRLQGGQGTFAVISSVTNPFCDSCNRIRLTADGKLKNCLFSQSETDLLTVLRSGGDIKDLIIGSVLNKKAVRGGMDSFEQLADPVRHGANRSMVAIGG